MPRLSDVNSNGFVVPCIMELMYTVTLRDALITKSFPILHTSRYTVTHQELVPGQLFWGGFVYTIN